MNKNNLYIIGALIIGVVVGGLLVKSTGQNSSTNHTANSSSMMGSGQQTSMQSTMDSMMASMHGKTGDDFDKAFMQEMTIHHQGAITMAEAALKNAKHEEIKQMAQDIITAQTKEINQMKQWQAQWYNQ